MKGAFWYTTLKCRPFNLAKALTVIRLRSLEDEHALSPATPSSTIASLFSAMENADKTSTPRVIVNY